MVHFGDRVQEIALDSGNATTIVEAPVDTNGATRPGHSRTTTGGNCLISASGRHFVIVSDGGKGDSVLRVLARRRTQGELH